MSAAPVRIAGLGLSGLIDVAADQTVQPRELVLRVQAILRRGGPPAGQGVTSYGEGELVIDEPRRR